jgi:crossover junction endodeoxyribonuclease RuvC
MRIIGIDPGLVHTGVGIIENIQDVPASGNGVKLLHTELLKPPRGDLSKRLLFIHDRLVDLVTRFNTETMAVEDQFFGKNVQTAFKTGQARGAALLAAARCRIPVQLFPPARVKLAVTGSGRASKEQVRFMVGRILNLTATPVSLDCTDALAVALCKAFTPDRDTNK